MAIRHMRRLIATVMLSGFVAATVWAVDTRRAPPPKFDAASVNEIFFSDARKLLGPNGPPKPGGPGGGQGGNTGPGGPATTGGGEMHADGNAWSTLISADSLEGEIKTEPSAIDAALKAPNPQKETRMVITTIAALYGVIYRYDKDVRWKNDSQALRDSFARAGNNLKAWTDSQKKQVAKLKTDLSDLIQGNPPALTPQLDGEAPWMEIADRPPIMHRLEFGQGTRLNAWSKDAQTVKANKDAFVREAEIITALARIIQDKSYEFADDADYMKFAKELEAQAHTAAESARKDDGAAASSAVSKMQKINFIEYEFEVPVADGDETPGRVTVMGAGGSIDDNVNRWKAQFKVPAAGEVKADVKQLEAAGVPVHLVDIKGIYLDKPGPFVPGPGVERPNYRMLSAIVATKDAGNYFIKFYGPEKTVTANEAAFTKMVEGMKAK